MPETSHHTFLPPTPKVTVLTAPFSGGQKNGGVEQGPQAIIKANIVQQLKELEYNVHTAGVQDFKKLEPKEDPNIGTTHHPRTVAAVNQEINNMVYQEAKEGNLVLTLGGDHSIAMGTVSGIAKAVQERLKSELALVWIDAHSDINIPATSGSGSMHGMPVAFLLGLVQNFQGFEWLAPCIKAENIVYIGLRDIDSGERKILKEHNIKCFSMHDVNCHGIGKVVSMALEYVNRKGKLPIHLSYDIDSLDPEVAPSTGTPVKGGLTFREGRYIAEEMHRSGQMVSMDLVEVNPSLCPIHAEKTVTTACAIIRASLGETLL